MRLVTADVQTRVLLVFALVLLLAHLCGRLAARRQQPEVLGEVVAGLLLGPSLLGRVAPHLSAWLFPPAVVGIVQALGQIGVALYAFEVGAGMLTSATGRGSGAGLASRPTAGTGPRSRSESRSGSEAAEGAGIGRSMLPLALASAALPALAGLALAPWLYGLHLAGASVGEAAFAMYLACAVGVTAVPVLARVLQDRHLEETRTGRLSIAAATVGDGICWCLLALSLWLAGRTSSAALLVALLGAGVIGVTMMLRRSVQRARAVGRFASAGWFGPVGGLGRSGPVGRFGRDRRSGGGDRSDGADRSGGDGPVSPALLAAVLASAGFSAWIGLHALLGGVLAGGLWAGGSGGGDGSGGGGGRGRGAGRAADVGAARERRTPPRGLQPLTRFFLPCFFLGSGLQVDLTAAAAPGLLGLVAVVAAVSLVSKFAACLALRRYYRLTRREVHRLGVLMSTKGMTELVVLSAGRQAGLISPRLYVALVAAALVLTLVTGPWLRALETRAEPAESSQDERPVPVPAGR